MVEQGPRYPDRRRHPVYRKLGAYSKGVGIPYSVSSPPPNFQDLNPEQVLYEVITSRKNWLRRGMIELHVKRSFREVMKDLRKGPEKPIDTIDRNKKA